MVVVSQSGCCVAYLIFIGQNLSSMITGGTEKQTLFIGVLLPLEIMLACVRSLAGLAPSSIFANVCNVLAMAIVVKDDFGSFEGFDGIIAFQKWTTFPFAFGIAIYCYEGFGMTLALESSMKKPHLFPKVLAQALLPITILYIAFGLIGYFAFCDETKDIITLNLPNDWWTVGVKLGLCIALLFTFPVMMYPVHELVESKVMRLHYFQRNIASRTRLCRFVLDCVRGVLVLIIAGVAVLVPTFGVFISLVGSTVCAMLAFVFPASFHLCVYKDCIALWQKVIDWLLIVGGMSFAIYGTYTTFMDMAS
jgi:proton-coupled amino acid transporter